MIIASWKSLQFTDLNQNSENQNTEKVNHEFDPIKYVYNQFFYHN